MLCHIDLVIQKTFKFMSCVDDVEIWTSKFTIRHRTCANNVSSYWSSFQHIFKLWWYVDIVQIVKIWNINCAYELYKMAPSCLPGYSTNIVVLVRYRCVCQTCLKSHVCIASHRWNYFQVVFFLCYIDVFVKHVCVF